MRDNTSIKLIVILIIIISCNSTNKTGNSKVRSDSLNKKDSNIVVLNPYDKSRTNNTSEREGKYWCLSTDSLKDNDLDYIPPSELRIMRNEIFAKYGLIFKSKDLQDYFRSQYWYKPLSENVDTFLTYREKTNIDFITQHEKVNKEISQRELFNFFLDKINNGKSGEIPRMLSHKYEESAFPNFQGDIKANKQVFKKAKKYKYLIYTRFNGCDQCPIEYCIYKFDLDGNCLDKNYLGNELSIEMKSENHIYCFGIEYPDINEDDENAKIDPKDIDTTITNITLSKDEEMLIR